MVSHFTSLHLSARRGHVIDCGTPWRSFQWLLKSNLENCVDLVVLVSFKQVVLDTQLLVVYGGAYALCLFMCSAGDDNL